MTTYEIVYSDGVRQMVECSSVSVARKVAADNMEIVYGTGHEWPDAEIIDITAFNAECAAIEIQEITRYECYWIDEKTGFHRNDTPVEEDGSCCSCGMI